jgi:hypothetical protein
MSSVIKDFLKIFRSKEGLNGFVFAVWGISIVLTSFGWALGIDLHGQTYVYWASVNPSTYVFGFPSYQNPTDYKLYITSMGANAGSITVIVQQVNGWNYNGTYYLGDNIAMGDYRVTIQSINKDRPNPIELDYYQVYDMKPLLLIISIVLTVIGLYRLVSLESQKRSGTKRQRPKKTIPSESGDKGKTKNS